MMSISRFMFLLSMLGMLSQAGILLAEDKPLSAPVKETLEKAETLNKQAVEKQGEADKLAEESSISEAIEAYISAKSILRDREDLLKSTARKTSTESELNLLAIELEKTSSWRKKIQDTINILRLSQ
jgi:hypothetical protein